MNFAEQKIQIMKGCGDHYHDFVSHGKTDICGKKFLCPICKAKLAQLEADMKMVEETIDKQKMMVLGGSEDDNKILMDSFDILKRDLKEKLFGGNNEKA